MSFSYNLGANPAIDYPRLLIADTDSTHPIFQDEEINSASAIDAVVFFPAVQSGIAGPTTGTASPRRTAATLLDALAANKARLSAALEVLDIKLDASKAAKALQDQAKALRDTEMNSGAFGIAELYLDQFTGRQRIWKQLLRIDAA
jgi:hypothetical protein